MNEDEIRYSKLIQKNGLREHLYQLDEAEMALATDTGQVYMGIEPSQNTYLTPSRIVLDPIPNIQNFVQYLIDSHNDYTHNYTVRDDLTIETESVEKAIEMINYINRESKQSYPNIHSVARVSNMMEFVTSLNVSDYTNPAYDNITYNPSIGFSQPSKRLLAKVLSIESGNLFLEFNRAEVNHIEIEYSLVQNSARGHKRSGKMTVIGDKHIMNAAEIGFVDEQTLIAPNVGSDHIRFNAIYDMDKIKILFEQPNDYRTRIFYKIKRWGMDQVTQFSEPFFYSDGSETELFVNGDQLGFNDRGAYVASKDTGDDE